MGQLEDMALFVRIVEAGSISKASEQLNIAKSAVSRRLSELEKRLEADLLVRTTRKWKLTDIGEVYYEDSKNILDDVSSLNADISGKLDRLEGNLKISAPLSFGTLYFSKIMDEFFSTYPNIKIRIDLTDRKVDIIEEGYELAVRIGKLKDSGLRAKKINTIRHSLVASPSYIKKYGMPLTPEALEEHIFVRFNLSDDSKIELYDSEGNKKTINTYNKIESNNGSFLKDMAVRGYGITYLPTFLVYESICNGDLLKILPEYSFVELDINVIYPSNRFLSRKARVFIDFLSEYCSQQPYWDDKRN